MSHKLSKRQVRSIKKMTEHKGQHELRKEQNAQRKLARAQRHERPPRQRGWLDDDAAPSFEKIRARTDTAGPSPTAVSEPLPGEVGTVIEVRSGDSLVAAGGRVVRGILTTGLKLVDPKTRSPLAVGDHVSFEPLSAAEVRIVAVLPRRSALRSCRHRNARSTARRRPRCTPAARRRRRRSPRWCARCARRAARSRRGSPRTEEAFPSANWATGNLLPSPAPSATMRSY